MHELGKFPLVDSKLSVVSEVSLSISFYFSQEDFIALFIGLPLLFYTHGVDGGVAKRLAAKH